MILEIISNSVESTIAAEKGGADRIELCENLIEGGVTPSMGCIELAVKNVNIAVNVMIRPRGGDFLYTDHEFNVMKKNIELVRDMGVQGVVFGILHPDGNIDIERNKELVELAGPLNVTFHRAFDAVADPFKALEDVIAVGADRILTSGHAKTAIQGATMINKLILNAAGRVKIMPGGGINETNITELIEKTGAEEFHFSAKTLVESNMRYRKDTLNIGYRVAASEYERIIVDENKVRQVKELMMEFQD